MIDLATLRDRLHASLPQLTYELVELTHSMTLDSAPALTITTEERSKDCVYKMTIASIGDHVHFFVHVHGKSHDLTTRGAQQFRKKCDDVDEVFAIVHTCWTGGLPS